MAEQSTPVVPEKPAEKPTLKLPQDEINQGLLTKLQRTLEGFREETARDLDTVKNEGVRTGLRMTRVEARLDDVETRLSGHSIRASAITKTDEAQDAALAAAKAELAQERAARQTEVTELKAQIQTLTTKTDAQTQILQRLDRFTESPRVRNTVSAVLGLIGVAAVYYTMQLQARMSTQSATPPAPAPVVVYVSPDGGLR